MYKLTLCLAMVAVAAAGAQDRDKGIPPFGKGPPPGKGLPPGDQVDRLARKLERDARELREEVVAHFRRSPQFKDLERHTREVERQAGLMRKLTDRDARPRMLRETLGKIDDEVRDIDRHIREMAREKELDRRAYDHLRDEIADIGRTLYRLRKELP